MNRLRCVAATGANVAARQLSVHNAVGARPMIGAHYAEPRDAQVTPQRTLPTRRQRHENVEGASGRLTSDRVKTLLVKTAAPMPGYVTFDLGAGLVDALEHRAAVTLNGPHKCLNAGGELLSEHRGPRGRNRTAPPPV